MVLYDSGVGVTSGVDGVEVLPMLMMAVASRLEKVGLVYENNSVAIGVKSV